MQFPVPQFTDVEDKIIGSLSLKQFGIIFGAGLIVFLAFTATKSTLVTVFFGLAAGLPALAIAFGKLNGRPLYNSLSFFIRFLLSPKVLIFHKEVNSLPSGTKLKDAGIALAEKAPEVSRQTTQARLLEVQNLLEKNAEEEKTLVKEIN